MTLYEPILHMTNYILKNFDETSHSLVDLEDTVITLSIAKDMSEQTV